MSTPIVTTEFPLRLGRGGNEREHWRKAHKRKKLERGSTLLFVRHALAGVKVPRGKLEVQLVRIGPSLIDSDNAVASLKYVRDVVAECLGRDDGPRSGIEWRYDTEQRGRGVWGVRVEIRRAA